MVAYNFIKQFADDVESGKKLQTIRKVGKRKHALPGDTLQLYTGMQTKSCRLLREALCTTLIPIRIRPSFGEVLFLLDDKNWLVCDSEKHISVLAQKDGFANAAEFFDYFAMQCDETGRFDGYLIKWEPKE
jgi:hypothetical protein